MYCSNCGTKNEGNKFCVKCGNKLNVVSSNNTNDNVSVKKETSGLKTASIILGILGIVGALVVIFAPVSLILTIIGLILGIVATKKVKNVSGIVLNSVGLFLSIIMLGLFILVIMFATEEYDNNNYYDDSYYGSDSEFNIDDYFNDIMDEYYNDDSYGDKGEYY